MHYAGILLQGKRTRQHIRLSHYEQLGWAAPYMVGSLSIFYYTHVIYLFKLPCQSNLLYILILVLAIYSNSFAIWIYVDYYLSTNCQYGHMLTRWHHNMYIQRRIYIHQLCLVLHNYMCGAFQVHKTFKFSFTYQYMLYYSNMCIDISYSVAMSLCNFKFIFV